MRLFSVCEELLPVDPVMMEATSLKTEKVLRYQPGTGTSNHWDRAPQTGDALTVALLGSQIQVLGPTQSSLIELTETIRIGRALADRAARAQETRAVALGSPVLPPVPGPPEEGVEHANRTLKEKQRRPTTCGFHMHIAVDSPEEGVQVLDRIRIWLPVLLALSTNSPFWHGQPSRFSSHRYFMSSKWPSPGPSNLFGSVEVYDRQMRHLTHPAAARSAAVTNLDAQLSATGETLDVLLADVSMDAEHAAVLAAVTRALVEVMARQWRKGIPPPPATVAELRAASWFAAMNGLDGKLMSPHSDRMLPVEAVVTELLELVCPVLKEYGDTEHVAAVTVEMLRHGNGSRRQRDAYALRQEPHDVVEAALRGTHNPNHTNGVPGAILAESWNLTDTEKASIGAAGR